MSNTYQIYLISDSTGETLDRIFLALKAQFKNIEYKVHSYSFTRTENQILKILDDAKKNENSLPKKLRENPQVTCVVGLNTEPERLVDLRKNRMNSLKETENIKYTSIENIKKEIEEAKKTFRKYRWPSIDVTRKSVEETAASIIKIHEIYLNNVK